MVTRLIRPLYRLVLVALLFAAWSVGPALSLAESVSQPAEPAIGARAAIVVEYPSGRVLYAKAMHDRLAPASTTKILTAILALEHGNLDDAVTISTDDLVGESTMGLASGERQTLYNLLYGMLLPSGNDAAMAVARYLGSQNAAPGGKDPVARFADMMNARIAQLGLQDSHFVNPHGLDANGHYSSAYDLASLTWYAFQFTVFNEVVKQPFYQAPGHSLKNTNEMLSRYAGSDGVKTGWTDAGGLCLVTSATRDGHRLISVVLNAPRWYTDSGAVLDYGFARLAAEPGAGGGEVLSVAARGTANWLLADATSTPPIAAPPAMAQGGGAAPERAGDGAAGGGAAGRSVAGKFVAHAPLTASASSAGRLGLLGNIILPLFALLAIVGVIGRWTLIARWPGFGPRSLIPPLPLGGTRTAAANRQSARSGAQPAATRPHRPPARTLGEPPVLGRREPSLMLTAAEACGAHIERAVALANDGRQGSSMAEFLLALRSGCWLNVAEVDAEFRLPQAGFLALARAQAAAGMLDNARETLQYAVASMPYDGMLRLSLRQLDRHASAHDLSH